MSEVGSRARIADWAMHARLHTGGSPPTCGILFWFAHLDTTALRKWLCTLTVTSARWNTPQTVRCVRQQCQRSAEEQQKEAEKSRSGYVATNELAQRPRHEVIFCTSARKTHRPYRWEKTVTEVLGLGQKGSNSRC